MKRTHKKASDLLKIPFFGARKALSRWRYFFFRKPYLEKIIVYLKQRKGEFLDEDRLDSLSDVPPVDISITLPPGFKVGLVKDLDNYGEKIQKVAHWYKYERFLVHNSIDYEIFHIHKSNWLEEAKKFSLVIFRPDISPWALHEARSKIDYLEKRLQIRCFPSSEEIWSYEDKIRLAYLYSHYNIPHVPTFISHDKDESLTFSESCSYPLISKINTGSASKGVQMFRELKKTRKFIQRVFAEGVSTYWPGNKQKDYVFFQPLIEHKGYDLRIMIIGNKAFGYFKMLTKGDFRASGGMCIKKSALPQEAVALAYDIKNKFNFTFLAVDFLEVKATGDFLVLETSIFVDIFTSAQAIVNDEPGYYAIRVSPFQMEFVAGRYWLQELILDELIKSQINE